MKRKNVREIALDTLLLIEKEQAYSNLLLNKMIEKNEMNRKDIGLLTEIVYGTTQRKLTLDFYLSPFINKNKKIELWVRILLQLSLYQLIYLDRIPERAILFEAVEIAKKRGHKGIASFVNGILRTVQREGLPSFESIADPVERLSIETSHPFWLVNRWVNQLGIVEARKMCEATLTPPEQSARINSTLTNRENILHQLNEAGVEAVIGDVSDDAIKAVKGNIAHTAAFKEGLFTIQDESSMLVARALGIERGANVLDSCAAPGGKTTHIAELLDNTGSVISLDLHEHKVKLIDEQVRRLKLTNVKTMTMDSRHAGENFAKESFDRVLVDAPCSGFGVIRRKPDIKYTKKESDIKNITAVQLSILTAVSALVKKGGILVYSTCTIEYEENAGVITEFLEKNKDFTLDDQLSDRLPQSVQPFVKNGQVQLFPHYFGTDGFYIASLRKQV